MTKQEARNILVNNYTDRKLIEEYLDMFNDTDEWAYSINELIDDFMEFVDK